MSNDNKARHGESNIEHLRNLPENTNFKEIPDSFWQKHLTPLQYQVCRKAGTERPFTGYYNTHYKDGIFYCSVCGQPLFSSKTKFNSGSGWPSFYEPISPDAVTLHEDHSYGMFRIEVRCSRCDSHLGHVFNDGPPPTGKRYCINSVCLFQKE
ncbi:MAG: peptide-methionine (R)-S-oxide reductase [Candidatus Hydrogenedentota bacterium]|nr:MAG: peptide-methionine (R)-S-oxide reductase [Candidatus Hydrogenedentota bacterium]